MSDARTVLAEWQQRTDAARHRLTCSHDELGILHVKLLAALRAVEALCNDPYAVEFIEAPEDGVLVSDIRQAINDALLASEPSGSKQ